MNVVLRDLDLHFQSQTVQLVILTRLGNCKQKNQVFGSNANVVHRDLDLLSQGHEF